MKIKNINATTLQICRNIRLARDLKGYSQQKMADLLDEKRSTYAEWEKNTEPQIGVFLKIAEILEVDAIKLAGKKNIEVKKDSLDCGANSGSQDQDPVSFLRKVGKEQRALAQRIDSFLKGYQQRPSKSGTDLPSLESEVEKLHGTGDEKGRENTDKANRNKKP